VLVQIKYFKHKFLIERTVSDMSGRASRPAQEYRRSIREKLNSNNLVMYIYPLYMRCHTPTLFTGIAVLSHLV
jgi:hypothetical protein